MLVVGAATPTSSASGSTTELTRTMTSTEAAGPLAPAQVPEVEHQVRGGERQVGQQCDHDQPPLQPDGGRGQDDGQPDGGAPEVAEQVLAERRREVDRGHVGVEALREQQRPQAEHALDGREQPQPRSQQCPHLSASARAARWSAKVRRP